MRSCFHESEHNEGQGMRKKNVGMTMNEGRDCEGMKMRVSKTLSKTHQNFNQQSTTNPCSSSPFFSCSVIFLSSSPSLRSFLLAPCRSIITYNPLYILSTLNPILTTIPFYQWLVFTIVPHMCSIIHILLYLRLSSPFASPLPSLL